MLALVLVLYWSWLTICIPIYACSHPRLASRLFSERATTHAPLTRLNILKGQPLSLSDAIFSWYVLAIIGQENTHTSIKYCTELSREGASWRSMGSIQFIYSLRSYLVYLVCVCVCVQYSFSSMNIEWVIIHILLSGRILLK